MPEFVRVKLMQVDFGAQSPARDPYCAVSIKEAIADAGNTSHDANLLVIELTTHVPSLLSKVIASSSETLLGNFDKFLDLESFLFFTSIDRQERTVSRTCRPLGL